MRCNIIESIRHLAISCEGKKTILLDDEAYKEFGFEVDDKLNGIAGTQYYFGGITMVYGIEVKRGK